MDNFFEGMGTTIAIICVAGLVYAMGVGLTYDHLAEQCDMGNNFNASGHTYECKRVE